MVSCSCLVTFVVLAGFVRADIQPAGTSIPIKRAPYKVLIIDRFDQTQVIGTGAILNNHWIITTGSTVTNYKNKPHSLMIRSGSGIYNEGGGLHEVHEIVIHPDFQPASTNKLLGRGDLALLKIYFSFHPSLKVARIPTPYHVTDQNTTSHVVAWPIESGNNTKALQMETTETVNWEKCRELYSSTTALDVSTLCTTKLKMMAQEGDLLVSRAKLIGLLKKPSSMEMDVYMDIASYKTWIDQITSK